MTDMWSSVVGVAGCFGAILADADVSSVGGWMQNFAYGAGAGILVWQLVKAYKRNDELQQKNLELAERMLHMCGGCEHVKYANEIAKKLHEQTMETMQENEQ